MLTQEKDFEDKRDVACRQARGTNTPYYFAVRVNAVGELIFGCGTLAFGMETTTRTKYKLENALYYEVYDPQGLRRVVYNDHDKLMQLGGYDLPLLEASEPAQEPARTTATSAAPLWWEVERASKAEQREALIALRRSVRALVNYD